ncbi:MAG: B12-binding domain-containing radical SAM protein [Deltaproteobacteria bacterium]|nr:MAG: B12-binding domain-containing radical SAM protein [Deltaproteobacteria bacterium]
MRILLVNPYCLEKRLQEDDISVVPIGLYYVGAVLKEHGFDVEILNWYNVNESPGIIEKTFSEKKPDIVGFSVLHANRWGAIEIAQIAKKINPETKVVFGGIGATFLWEHFLKNFPVVDYVVLGEGEYPFLELVEKLSGDLDKPQSKIAGIAFRKDGVPHRTERRKFIENLDELPHPSRYFAFQHLSSTRGCPWNCTFCGSPGFWNRKVRFHSPEYFVKELELQYRRGINFFYVSDDTFTIDKKRVIRICELIEEKGMDINWVAISRVNYVDDDILRKLRRAGCIQISYGVESGSEKIRKVLKKRIRTKDIVKAFRSTVRYGIMPRAYFIYGSPGESWETINESVELIKKIKPLSVIFYILDIFPGTELYEDFKKRLNVSDEIWLKKIEDIMYFETDPALTKEMVLSFGEKLRKEFFGNLPQFAEAIELVDDKEFYRFHADFLSRLGLTFSHGDYAQNKLIPNSDDVAQKLFERSLNYYPNPRAYLGLGMIFQKKRKFEDSVKILKEGINQFPQNDRLNLCLAVSYMNLQQFVEALSCLARCKENRESLYYMACCYRVLGDREAERKYLKKYERTAGIG